MSDLFHDQSDDTVVLFIPVQDPARRNQLDLGATVGLDGSTQEDVEQVLEKYDGAPMANKNRLKKELADTIQQHVTVQVEEQ